jgi:hypothetical protein
MNQRLSIFVVFLFLFPLPVVAGETRIVLLFTPDSDPPPGEVVHLLDEQLASLDVRVDPCAVETLPVSAEQWVDSARIAGREKPGMIALFGYTCTRSGCRLFVVEHRQKTWLEVPVRTFRKKTSSGNVLALVETIREVLLGPLFPELKRLSLVGENLRLSSSTKENIWWKPPLEGKKTRFETPPRPALWIEGGVYGETAFHYGGPTGGPWVGVQYEPYKRISVGLDIGWLGIQEVTEAPGTVRTHRLTTMVSASYHFPVGPVVLSVAPVVRFDTVLVETIPTDSAQINSAELEIQVGGMTVWHLPIIRDLEAVVGVGLLASVLSNDYGIDSAGSAYDDMIPASVLRLLWIVGIAWSPPGVGR